MNSLPRRRMRVCHGVYGTNCPIVPPRKLPYLTWLLRERGTPYLLRILVEVDWAVTKTTTASPRAAAVITTIKILTTVHPEFGQNFRVRATRWCAALPLLRRSLTLPAKVLVPLR